MMSRLRRTALVLSVCASASCGASDPGPIPIPPTLASASPSATASSTAPASASAVASSAPAPSSSASPNPPRMLGFDDKKKIVLAVVDAFNAHDATRLAAQYDPKCSATMPSDAGRVTTRDRAELARERTKLFAMIPDVRMELVRVYISPGDVLTMDWILTGTDTKGLNGAKPSNAKIGVHALTAWWLDPRNEPFVYSDATYYDLASIYAQTTTTRGQARPIAAPPSAPSFDWGSDASASGPPTDGPSDDEIIDAFYTALADNDVKAIAGKLADDIVWSDLTKRDDVVGAKSVLAMLAAQVKSGRQLAQSGRSGGMARESTWNVTRGGKQTAARTADLIEVKDGKVTRVTVYGNARE